MATEDTECSICLLKFVHPVQLPCGHVFCFLCIKGCAFHRRRCPMCRSRFTHQFFENPKLINDVEECVQTALEHSHEGHLDIVNQGKVHSWFYEGYSGWWQYDERTTVEIESAFRGNLSSCDLLIAGYIYTIDFGSMTQCRKDRSGRKRRIKRDIATSEKKGVAGIPLSCISAPEGGNHDDTTASTSRSDSSFNVQHRNRHSSPHSESGEGPQRHCQTYASDLPAGIVIPSPETRVCTQTPSSRTSLPTAVPVRTNRRATRSSRRNLSI